VLNPEGKNVDKRDRKVTGAEKKRKEIAKGDKKIRKL